MEEGIDGASARTRRAPEWPEARRRCRRGQETLVAKLSGWSFIGIDGGPLIARKPAGAADEKRRAFLSGLAPIAAEVFLPLDYFAREIGRTWDKQLPPDFPAGYHPKPMAGTPPPDLVAAVAVLMRVGLLVVDGFKVDAVTRTDFNPSQLGYVFVRNEEGLAPQLYWPGNAESGVTVGPGYDMGAGRRTR